MESMDVGGPNRREKEISFLKNEIPSLIGRETIITTRVLDDYGKYYVGDSVVTPWGDRYAVTDRIDLEDVSEHPFFDELTDDQIVEISRCGAYCVLELMIL
jgi:hypothetical protein